MVENEMGVAMSDYDSMAISAALPIPERGSMIISDLLQQDADNQKDQQDRSGLAFAGKTETELDQAILGMAIRTELEQPQGLFKLFYQNAIDDINHTFIDINNGKSLNHHFNDLLDGSPGGVANRIVTQTKAILEDTLLELSMERMNEAEDPLNAFAIMFMQGIHHSEFETRSILQGHDLLNEGAEGSIEKSVSLVDDMITDLLDEIREGMPSSQSKTLSEVLNVPGSKNDYSSAQVKESLAESLEQHKDTGW